MTGVLPVMRPRLPAARQLLPFLERIDASRVYSNYGPLSEELERRLAAHYGVHERMVTTVANGTLALALALAVQEPRPGTLCVMPAWTFIASVQAAILAGLVPYLVDVHPRTWAMDPEAVENIIAHAPGEVGAVMPVAPFGMPIDVVAWNDCRSRCGVPIVIDAAAGFDTATPTDLPVIVSLHATKVLGVGEGAFVLCRDADLIRRLRVRANFGFAGTRESVVPALNAKMSEYHAAVGLAALDAWNTIRGEWLVVAEAYRAHLDRTAVRLQTGFGQTWVSSVCLWQLDGPDTDTLEQRFTRSGIETRRWWNHGAHQHAAARHLPRTELPITDHLARSTIAVPMFLGMPQSDVERVTSIALAITRRP